ncbi:2124_t:CDS:2 [Diversispora eburnea]|uniref:2124_t:CDS:1 n=1 Tax=Diversispora eburnea TaxID=1213867 RepID=A0A9N9BK41_9GLOM|nr:2124_t:CDS:2 [Diversispora eburnea]
MDTQTNTRHFRGDSTSHKTLTPKYLKWKVKLELSSIFISNKTQSPIPSSNPNKIYQYAIEHEIYLEKFSVITEAEKNRWTMDCFRADLERDICLYHGGLERNEDTRKYYKFLTDRERLVGKELLCHSILKSGLSIAWLNNLMEEW